MVQDENKETASEAGRQASAPPAATGRDAASPVGATEHDAASPVGATGRDATTEHDAASPAATGRDAATEHDAASPVGASSCSPYRAQRDDAAGNDMQSSERTADDVFAKKVSTRSKAIIAVIFLAVFLVSLFSGSYSLSNGYTPLQTLQTIWNHIFDPGAVADHKLDLALFNIRLPRILLALLVGAALSTAGASFQGMFKNPLVSPDLLGASAGASLGACLMMLNGMPNIMIQLGAFLGGLVAVSITMWMRNLIKSDAILGLVLAGMLVSTLFQSGMSFIKLVADTNNTLPAITYWLMGSFHDSRIDDILLAILPMLLGFVLMLSQSWKLNVMSFGDDEARSMGVNTRVTRIVVILGATLVTSTSVAVAGIIGWVGLVIPHFARAIVGPNYKVLLPTCLLLGSAYLLLIDDFARMLIPGINIPIGILTAILGVPLFLVIFRKTSKGW